MNSRFCLEQEGEEILLDADHSAIEVALSQIHPQNRSFYILSRGDGSYVQIAGAKLRLIIEFRQVEKYCFRHYVIGRRSDNAEIVSINYSGGAIKLQKNEVLYLDDAKKITSSFMQEGAIPPEYLLRDITTQFKPC